MIQLFIHSFTQCFIQQLLLKHPLCCRWGNPVLSLMKCWSAIFLFLLELIQFSQYLKFVQNPLGQSPSESTVEWPRTLCYTLNCVHVATRALDFVINRQMTDVESSSAARFCNKSINRKGTVTKWCCYFSLSLGKMNILKNYSKVFVFSLASRSNTWTSNYRNVFKKYSISKHMMGICNVFFPI